MQVTASLICKAVTIINVQITLCAAAAVQRDPEGAIWAVLRRARSFLGIM